MEEYEITYAIAPAVIPAIAAGVTALMGYIQSRRNTDKTNKANKQLAEYQYSKDLEMWNLQNKYNTPQAQMQRFQEGGLNPNLIYTQGNAGNASQMAKYQAPTVKYDYTAADPAGALEQYQNIRMQQAQIDNVRAQREATEARIGTEQFNMLLRESQYKSSDYMYNYGISPKVGSLQEKLRQDVMKTSLAEQGFPYQLSMQQGKARQVDLQNKKLLEDTEFVKSKNEYQLMVNDWYVNKIIGQLGLGLIGKFGLSMSKSGAIGKPTGRAASVNERTRERAFDETTRKMRQFGMRQKMK